MREIIGERFLVIKHIKKVYGRFCLDRFFGQSATSQFWQHHCQFWRPHDAQLPVWVAFDLHMVQHIYFAGQSRGQGTLWRPLNCKAPIFYTSMKAYHYGSNNSSPVVSAEYGVIVLHNHHLHNTQSAFMTDEAGWRQLKAVHGERCQGELSDVNSITHDARLPL